MLPSTVKELKSFLAMLNFYRRFIPNAIEAQIPLLEMTPGNKRNDRSPLSWSDETVTAFDRCKQQLAHATLLAHPAKSAELSLWVDASDFAAGAVLHQIVEGKVQPLGFFSKKFDKAQLRYSTYDRELTAIYLAVRHFKFMLEGRSCHIYTDHKPIIFAFRQKLDKASFQSPSAPIGLHWATYDGHPAHNWQGQHRCRSTFPHCSCSDCALARLRCTC